MRMGWAVSLMVCCSRGGLRVPLGRTMGSGRFDSVDNVHRNIGNLSSAAIALRPLMKRPPCLAAALACLAVAAFAQTPSSRDIYMYQGADREARLVAGAKKERQVAPHSTMTVAGG